MIHNAKRRRCLDIKEIMSRNSNSIVRVNADAITAAVTAIVIVMKKKMTMMMKAVTVE